MELKPEAKIMILVVSLILLFAGTVSADIFGDDSDSGGSLGCYKCISSNGSNPECDDEFIAKAEFYDSSCKAARKSYIEGRQSEDRIRVGLYPATHCIKFKATDKATGETIMVRDCATDSGGTTTDTEIGGMSHCGILMKDLIFNGQYMEGCIMTCKINGCNGAGSPKTMGLVSMTVSVFFTNLLLQK